MPRAPEGPFAQPIRSRGDTTIFVAIVAFRGLKSRARPQSRLTLRCLPCEHTFVSSEGHAYARFRRALDSRNATVALSAASELEHVGLPDALELCLLLRDQEPRRFDRAALRWHGRYCREVADVTLAEGQAVLALLAALSGERGPAAARALADLFDRRELLPASEALVRWADARK